MQPSLRLRRLFRKHHQHLLLPPKERGGAVGTAQSQRIGRMPQDVTMDECISAGLLDPGSVPLNHYFTHWMCAGVCHADTLYPNMAKKFWPLFIRSQQYCESLVKNPNFLRADNSIRDDWCRAFVKYLADVHDVSKHKQTLKKATSWLQGRIVHCCTCALVAPPPKGYVVSLPVVSTIVGNTALAFRQKNMHTEVDCAAEFEAIISFDEMHSLVEKCYGNKVPGCVLLACKSDWFAGAGAVSSSRLKSYMSC